MSFRREKYIPKGGPNGGDGGKGGDVILLCERNMNDLTDYKFRPEWKAENGGTGQGREKHGKNGANLELRLPPGTVVLDRESGEFLCELTAHGQRVRVLRGGRGGLGNIHFKSSTNQTPRQTIPGKPGQQGEFQLVLKTIADVGLVGFPNAGKSSMLELLTNATPKTAPYPFTTLHPYVGVIDYPEEYDAVTLADVPGLIEGAAENRGLGHRFLKHIERCRLLLILIDMSGIDGRAPEEDYAHLLRELECYDASFSERPRLVVANKMDEPDAEENLKRFRRAHAVPVLPVSILSEEGIAEMKAAILERVREIREQKPEESPPPEDITIEDTSENIVIQHEHTGRRKDQEENWDDLPELGEIQEVTDWEEDEEEDDR